MAKTIIFVFSGTGNTANVADNIKKSFEEKSIDTDVRNIDEIKDSPDVTGYDYVGVGFPIYAWAVPINVEEFVNRIPHPVNGQKAFAFSTCGGMSLYAVEECAELLRGRGYEVIRSREFKMPDNYLISFISKLGDNSEEGITKRFSAIPGETKKYVDEILSGNKEITPSPGFIGKGVSKVLGGLFKKYGRQKDGEKLYVKEDKCSNCNLCVKICPAGNISVKDGKITFGKNCYDCCRCYNLCPTKAINHPGSPDPALRYKAPGYKPPAINEV